MLACRINASRAAMIFGAESYASRIEVALKDDGKAATHAEHAEQPSIGYTSKNLLTDAVIGSRGAATAKSWSIARMLISTRAAAKKGKCI